MEIDQFQSSPTSELLPFTPPESNGHKRKRRDSSEGKQTLKGRRVVCYLIDIILILPVVCSRKILKKKYALAIFEHF